MVCRAAEKAATEEGQAQGTESPDAKAVKYLISKGLNRVAALESYSAASQHAYWSKVTLSENVYAVVECLGSVGITDTNLAEVVSAHPVVLAYNAPERLQPALDYLVEIGVTNLSEVIRSRPSLLGLDPNEQLKRIVEYLKSTERSTEEIVQMVSETI